MKWKHFDRIMNLQDVEDSTGDMLRDSKLIAVCGPYGSRINDMVGEYDCLYVSFRNMWKMITSNCVPEESIYVNWRVMKESFAKLADRRIKAGKKVVFACNEVNAQKIVQELVILSSFPETQASLVLYNPLGVHSSDFEDSKTSFDTYRNELMNQYSLPHSDDRRFNCVITLDDNPKKSCVYSQDLLEKIYSKGGEIDRNVMRPEVATQ